MPRTLSPTAARVARRAALPAAVAVVLSVAPLAAVAGSGRPAPAPLVVRAAATEPVVLTGADFPGWSGGPELTARAPEPPTDYGVADSQGNLPPGVRSDCYRASPAPDVNGYRDPNHGDHNCYQHSVLPVRTVRTGIDPASLRGYRWTGRRFVQIPFQVDTKWTHYISNNASGFAFYSGIDQELTYTFDREGFRYTTNAPFDPADPAVVCHAEPVDGVPTTPDPNKGLIDTDEMAFMARDAGPAAPAGAALPKGIAGARQVELIDPNTGRVSYVYVMQSARRAGGGYAVPMAYTAANSPYVHYARDPNADTFVYSQSSYSDYGNAPKGPVCSPQGQPVVGEGFKAAPGGTLQLDPARFVQRRPLDTATVWTPRYRFRFDGRWLMDALQVSHDDRGFTAGDYGPSIVDRFKGRAFQQTPGGNTPCCGYEDEQTNWGGSSVVMGEKVGPVRVIRVTWGSDSGTNVVRTDIFYAYSVQHVYELRVHPIPPLDGIYTQWDMAAGQITHYYNSVLPAAGVPVWGVNTERYGNAHLHAGPDGLEFDSADTVGGVLRGANGGRPLTVGHPNDATCGSSTPAGSNACLYGNFDVPDATFSGVAPTLLLWEELTGPGGTMVEKWGAHQVTPLGTALAAVAAVPYYRDDACFDDGTGNNPGPKIDLRSAQEPTTYGQDPVTGVWTSPAPKDARVVYQRRCWNHHADGTPYNIPGTPWYDPKKRAERPDPLDPGFSPQGDIRYYQGDIATHGLHLEFIVDSDNAQLTVPVDEIDAQDTQIILGGQRGNVGSAYAATIAQPVQAVVTPYPLG